MNQADVQAVARQIESVLQSEVCTTGCQIREVELEGCLSALGGCAFAMLDEV